MNHCDISVGHAEKLRDQGADFFISFAFFRHGHDFQFQDAVRHDTGYFAATGTRNHFDIQQQGAMALQPRAKFFGFRRHAAEIRG